MGRGVKGNDVDKEGVCDGEGSKRFVFLSVASFGSLLLFLRKGGGELTPVHIYDLSDLLSTTATCLISHLQPFRYLSKSSVEARKATFILL